MTLAVSHASKKLETLARILNVDSHRATKRVRSLRHDQIYMHFLWDEICQKKKFTFFSSSLLCVVCEITHFRVFSSLLIHSERGSDGFYEPAHTYSAVLLWESESIPDPENPTKEWNAMCRNCNKSLKETTTRVWEEISALTRSDSEDDRNWFLSLSCMRHINYSIRIDNRQVVHILERTAYQPLWSIKINREETSTTTRSCRRLSLHTRRVFFFSFD